MIGQVEAAVQAGGVSGDTYIVFSSDNGLHTGECRLMPGKLTAYDTDIHVPLVITGPGVRAGTSTDRMTENVDLAETFATLDARAWRATVTAFCRSWTEPVRRGGGPLCSSSTRAPV